MKPMPDPWPRPRVNPELLKKRCEEVLRRGDMQEKLADLSFLRELHQRDGKLRKAELVITSFKTQSELDLWCRSVGEMICNCHRKDTLLNGHEPDCRVVDEFLKLSPGL